MVDRLVPLLAKQEHNMIQREDSKEDLDGQWSVKQPEGRRLVWREPSGRETPDAEEDVGPR